MRPVATPPPASPALTATRWYRGPTVRGSTVEPCRAPRRLWRRRCVAARRGLRRDPPGRARTEGHLRGQGRQGHLPRPAVDRAPDRDGPAGAQHRHADGAERRRLDRLLRLRQQLSRTGRQQTPDLDRRTGSRGDPQASGREPGRSARPAVARRPTSTPGRSARSRPGTRSTFLWRVVPGEGRPAHRPLHGRRRPLRQGPRAVAHGGPPHGHFTVHIAPEPPRHPRRSRTPARSCPAHTRTRSGLRGSDAP